MKVLLLLGSLAPKVVLLALVQVTAVKERSMTHLVLSAESREFAFLLAFWRLAFGVGV